MSGIYDFKAKMLSGQERSMNDFAGKVLLIVNTASKCGFTPQYAELEATYEKYAEKGFSILGFPCNQFGSQEPGDAAEISQFCSVNYGVTFPIFAKIDVNGENAHPLYQYLKAQKSGIFGIRAIKWNFTKFLIDRQGRVAARFAPLRKPSNLVKEIEPLLG
jgi:glutathione peroxidase